MPDEKVTFENRDGHTLSGRLALPPDGSPRAWALFAHCFTCTQNIRAARDVSSALAQEGVAVLRFDFTGLGESEGDFAHTDFSSNVADLVDAGAYMAEHLEAPQILVGHSLGGAAVIKAAAHLDSVRAVATIAAPADPEHVAHLLDHARDEIEARGEAEVTLAGRPFRIRREFLEDLAATSMERSIRELRRALLILHSPTDETVGIDNAATIYARALHPKSFVTLDGADHLLSDAKDSAYAGRLIATWAGRYVSGESEATEGADEGRDEPVGPDTGEWKVAARIGSEGFLTEVRAGGHGLLADEPASAGGTDRGPDPYGLLLSGLGACTAMTLRMYADRKEWPLGSVTVRLAHDRVHAEDCDDCESSEGKVDVIRRELEIEGDLDDDQREKLAEIADKCPVHRTLENEIRIRTALKEEGRG